MPSCVLLLPGALLPAPVASEVLRHAQTPVLAELLRGAQAPVRAQLAPTETLANAAHLAWLWRVIGHRDGVPITAPYAWHALGGPTLATEMWRVRPCHFALARDHMLLESLAGDPPSQAELDARAPALRAAAREAGFQLQEVDGQWFLARKTDWPLKVRPWESQLGATVGPDSAQGEAQLAWRKLLNEVQMAWFAAGLHSEREEAERRSFNGVWIEGGGRLEHLPPSNFRAVLANDETARGWALAAGISAERVRRLQNHWPEAPKGDLLAVIDDLAEAHRSEDWGAWLAALPAVEARIRCLVDAARQRELRSVVLVATGREWVSTVVRERIGWRFWRHLPAWQRTALSDWLSEAQADTAI